MDKFSKKTCKIVVTDMDNKTLNIVLKLSGKLKTNPGSLLEKQTRHKSNLKQLQ